MGGRKGVDLDGRGWGETVSRKWKETVIRIYYARKNAFNKNKKKNEQTKEFVEV